MRGMLKCSVESFPSWLLSLGALALASACSYDQREPPVGDGTPEDAAVGQLNPEPSPEPDPRPDPEKVSLPSWDAGETSPEALTDGGTNTAVLAACTPGESTCVSAVNRLECDASGSWGEPIACEYACMDGTCAGECTPGASECSSSTLVRICSNAAVWGDDGECENACVEDRCGGECRPGQSRCASGVSVETCSAEGAWGAEAPCENACVGQACAGECVPGSSRCFSVREVQACNAEGQWLTPDICDNACIGNQCGGECVPGSGRCQPSSGLPQICGGEGLWQDRPACPFVCSGSGVCSGECSPGTRRCSPSTGIPQLCSPAGAWQNQAACPFVCSGSGVCTGECNPPATRCVGTQLMTCRNNQFALEDTCLSAELCDEEAGICVANDCEDDTDPSSTLQRHPRFGCGQRWSFPNDPTGDWIEFEMGLHVDLETGNGWFAPGGSLTLAELTSACATLTVDGIGGFSVPTIDQLRELAAGCAPTEPGGSCRLSHPSCLSTTCGSCGSCLGGASSTGPAADGNYCRPNTRLCFSMHSRSTCTDCEVASDWSYGPSNGNVLARSSSTRFASFCVRPNFPF